MHRTRQRLVAILALAAGALAPRVALAFHTGNVFDKPPGAGGGGGRFYNGAPRERGLDCTACHLDAPHKTRVSARSDPPELVADGRYVPGATYDLTFTLDNEYLGLGSPLSNYNAIVVSAVDAKGGGAGSFSGYAAEDFYARGSSILASAGRQPNETSWAFRFRAPDSGAGSLSLYVGVVDGNGANSPPTQTLTDPFGDDVAVGRISAREQPAAGGVSVPAPWGGRLALLGLVGALLAGACVRFASLSPRPVSPTPAR